MKRKALTVIIGASLAARQLCPDAALKTGRKNEQTVVVSDMEIVEEETESEPETETEPQTETMSLELQEESSTEAELQTDSEILAESETEEENASADRMRPSSSGNGRGRDRRGGRDGKEVSEGDRQKSRLFKTGIFQKHRTGRNGEGIGKERSSRKTGI